MAIVQLIAIIALHHASVLSLFSQFSVELVSAVLGQHNPINWLRFNSYRTQQAQRDRHSSRILWIQSLFQ